jgi:hypothetical protein
MHPVSESAPGGPRAFWLHLGGAWARHNVPLHTVSNRLELLPQLEPLL